MKEKKKLKEISREYLNMLHKNREMIKIYLEITLLLTPILVLVLVTFEKLNFSSFYMIPSEYKELDIYRILQKLILVFIFLGIYFNFSFIEIDVPVNNFKKVLRLFKRKNKKIIVVVLKNLIIFFNLLYIGVISITLGVIYYFILTDSLIHFLPDWVSNGALNLSKLFYKFTFYFFLTINFILFLFYKLSKNFLRKISKFLIITIALIVVFYILKDVLNESEWKRSYELIISNEKLEVVLSKKDGKLIVADGEIIEKNGLNILNINTKKYKIKNCEDVILEYRNFSKVNIES